MSFLKKLFGGGTPADRLRRGLELESRGEPGLARLELEGALAGAGLGEAEAVQAWQALARVRERLAEEGLREARALLEAGDLDEARGRIELVLALGQDTPLAAAAQALAEDCRRQARTARPKAPPRVGVEGPRAAAAEAASAGGDEVAVEADGGGEGEGEEEPGPEMVAEGDDELTALEMALLVYPEPESDRLRALIAVEPRLGEGLALLHEGQAGAALALLAGVREPAASDPLVTRERAAAALLAAEPAEAARLLAASLPRLAADPRARELLLEARRQSGDLAGAAEVAQDMLGLGLLPGDLEGFASLLAHGGGGEAALARIDRYLDQQRSAPGRPGSSLRLWEMRAFLCQALGSEEGMRQADARAVELFVQEVAARGENAASFPLLSARRLASALAAEAEEEGGRRRAAEVVRLLLTHDREGGRRWRALLAELEG